MPTAPAAPPQSRGQPPEASYVYEGHDGKPHMLVCRYPGKRFLQYRPDGNGAWLPGLQQLVPVPYRLPEILAHIASNSTEPIYICEGEKDAEAIRAAGAVATTSPMGAGKWRDEYADWFMGARTVVVIADNDEPGAAHAHQVDAALRAVGVVPRLVRAAVGKDAADHLAADLGLDALVPLEGAPDVAPIFMDAYDFVDMQVEPPAPLWGNREHTIIPAGGLVVCAGRPGVGKTTWVVDLACHLAAGLPYPPTGDELAPDPWPVPRPLRIVLIENEGPIEMFRDKLGNKLERWPHAPFADAGGYLGVQVWRWGSFSFADEDTFRRVGVEMDDLQIDLVIGDPLAMLGMEGVGSPKETRDFVQLIRGLGLGHGRAFLFLHHFRERNEDRADELARISGAWGGHLDTLLTLQPMGHEDELRMAFPKLRWGRGRQPEPVVLGRIYNTQSYASLRREGDLAALEPLLVTCLADGREAGEGYDAKGWRTYTQLAAIVAGGRRKHDTKKALEGAPHLFARVTGTAAKVLGAKHNAILWGLREWPEAPAQAAHEMGDEAGDDVADVDVDAAAHQAQLGDDFPF